MASSVASKKPIEVFGLNLAQNGTKLQVDQGRGKKRQCPLLSERGQARSQLS